jgi:chromosome segregation ATPase
MKKIIFLFVLILLLPVSSWADYKVYLKNGSVISGIISYQEKDADIILYLSTGSMGILKKDVLKIEETESSYEEFSTEKASEMQEEREDITGSLPVQSSDDKASRWNALKAELDSVITEIRSAEEQEASLVSLINEKTGRRSTYNIYQLRQLENELEPLRKELSTIQQKKAQLVLRKNTLEDELMKMQ